MTSSPRIIDAGPALNFFSTNNERLLFATLGSLSAPEKVEEEMRRKARQETRFAPTERVLNKVRPPLFTVLSDDATPALSEVSKRLTSFDLPTRRTRGEKDLGELMVVAHAVVIAETGADVIVVIDDGGGARMAQQEARRLVVQQSAGRAYGSIQLIDTPGVLELAVRLGHIADKGVMRKIYAALRGCDDGLPSIEMTELLSDQVWAARPPGNQ